MANHVIRRQPLFSGLSDLHSALDRLLDRNVSEWEGDIAKMDSTQWIPKIDVTEQDNHFFIRADVPGVNPKDIEVLLENGLLTIKGQTESETKKEKENYLRVERAAGSFYRAISLPEVTDSSKITAKFKHGVLEITIPKNNKQMSHKIAVHEEK